MNVKKLNNALEEMKVSLGEQDRDDFLQKASDIVIPVQDALRSFSSKASSMSRIKEWDKHAKIIKQYVAKIEKTLSDADKAIEWDWS